MTVDGKWAGAHLRCHKQLMLLRKRSGGAGRDLGRGEGNPAAAGNQEAQARPQAWKAANGGSNTVGSTGLCLSLHAARDNRQARTRAAWRIMWVPLCVSILTSFGGPRRKAGGAWLCRRPGGRGIYGDKLLV